MKKITPKNQIITVDKIDTFGIKETKYKMDMVINSIAQGNFVSATCKNAGISRATFYKWLHREPGFREMIQNASRTHIGLVEDKLYQLAMDGNLGAIVFILCNRTPDWKNPQNAGSKQPLDPKVEENIEAIKNLLTNEQKKKIRK